MGGHVGGLAARGQGPRQALVRTGNDGNCILVCTDDCLVVMKAASTVQVLPQQKTIRLALLAGEALVRFPYVVDNDRNGVGLPQVIVLALAAGDYSFGVTDGTSVAKVLEGSAAVIPQGGGAQVSLSGGQFLEAGPNRLGPPAAFGVTEERSGWQPLLEQASLLVTPTSFAGTTTTDRLPPDAPVGTPTGAIVMLVIMGAGVLGVLAIIGTFIYLGVNRRNRRRQAAGRATPP